MKQTEFYQTLPVHFLNLINAYHNFQYHDHYLYQGRSLESTLAHDHCIYEFTALLQSSNKTTVDIQYGTDSHCKNLQIHISRLLLGNNFAKPNKNRLQPMLIGFFDFEGSRQGKIPKRCKIPHIHGFLVLHTKTKDKFRDLITSYDVRRLKLINIPSEFKEVSFQRIYRGNKGKIQKTGNEIDGIIKFADYSLKSDRLLQRYGEYSSIVSVYPKNKRWENYFNSLSAATLNKYHTNNYKKLFDNNSINPH